MAVLASRVALGQADTTDGRKVRLAAAGFFRNGEFVQRRYDGEGSIRFFNRGPVSQAGLLLAALTHRRIILDWPDVVRNFGATPPARLYPAREPKAGEWWLGNNSSSTWSETGMTRRDAIAATVEEVNLERVREFDSARFVAVQSGATALPMSPGAITCAARLFGSRICATNTRCVQGAAYRILLSQPTQRLKDNLMAVGVPGLDGQGESAASTIVGMHLRSWPKAMEGEDSPPRKVPIDDWATSFFECAEQAVRDIDGNKVIVFATDNPEFKTNATALFAQYGKVLFSTGDVTHTRTVPKSGAVMRTAPGGDSAVLDWFMLAEMSHVFVGTKASTYSNAIIDRGCLGRLTHFWELGISGDCGRSDCKKTLGDF